VKRREFIPLLGGAAAVCPLAARAQLQAMPVIGYLRSPGNTAHLVVPFHKGLSESGFVDGRNVTIEASWALGHTSAGGGVRSPAGSNDRRDRRRACRAVGSGGDLDHSDCVRSQRRSGQARIGCEPQSSRPAWGPD
jgi:hypothetical protein